MFNSPSNTLRFEWHSSAEWASDTVEWLTVEGHKNLFYNGDYWLVGGGDLWNGYEYFKNDNGAYLYYLDRDQDGTGCWQFDNREQEGDEDLYDGGYFDQRGSYEALYDEMLSDEERTVLIQLHTPENHITITRHTWSRQDGQDGENLIAAVDLSDKKPNASPYILPLAVITLAIVVVALASISQKKYLKIRE